MRGFPRCASSARGFAAMDSAREMGVCGYWRTMQLMPPSRRALGSTQDRRRPSGVNDICPIQPFPVP